MSLSHTLFNISYQEAPTEVKRSFSAILFKLLDKLVDLTSELDLAKPEERRQIAEFLKHLDQGICVVNLYNGAPFASDGATGPR